MKYRLYLALLVFGLLYLCQSIPLQFLRLIHGLPDTGLVKIILNIYCNWKHDVHYIFLLHTLNFASESETDTNK